MDIAITPYSHALFEKLVSKGCDLVLLLPENLENIGKGVRVQEKTKRSYRVCYSRIKKMWYGKHALIDIKKYLIEEKPDIFVVVWPYFLYLFFNRSIYKIIRSLNIRLMVKEIPFQVPPYGKLNYFNEHPVYDENMNLLSKSIGFKFRSLLTMYIRKYIYKRTSASINYFSGAKEIISSYGLSKDAIFYGNTTDTDSLLTVREKVENSPCLLEDKLRILHIGRLVKWKRVDLLINAFEILSKKYSECELVIIGNGPEKENLIKQVNDLNLSNKVIFTGGVFDSFKLGQYMHESSVYVLAGMGGLSINDAMCFSLPIICSVCDGTEKDLVQDGVNGYFFKEDDLASLVEKMELILSDPLKREDMGKKSYEIIKGKINLDTVSNKYMQAFSYAMKNPVK